MTDKSRLLTVPEVSELLRAHSSTIYRLLRAKKLPAFRVGADWRFNREQIVDWMAQQEKAHGK